MLDVVFVTLQIFAGCFSLGFENRLFAAAILCIHDSSGCFLVETARARPVLALYSPARAKRFKCICMLVKQPATALANRHFAGFGFPNLVNRFEVIAVCSSGARALLP